MTARKGSLTAGPAALVGSITGGGKQNGHGHGSLKERAASVAEKASSVAERARPLLESAPGAIDAIRARAGNGSTVGKVFDRVPDQAKKVLDLVPGHAKRKQHQLLLQRVERVSKLVTAAAVGAEVISAVRGAINDAHDSNGDGSERSAEGGTAKRATAAKKAPQSSRRTATKRAPAKTAAKKGTAKKAPAKKTAAKKTAGKKAPAKKTAAKKTAGKKAPARSTAKRKSSAKRASAR